MRFCIVCKKPMYTSNGSVWIGRKNYPCHVKCEQKVEK